MPVNNGQESQRHNSCENLQKRVDELYDKIESEGLDIVWSGFFTTCERFLDLPRKCELQAVISRMRHLHFAKERIGG